MPITTYPQQIQQSQGSLLGQATATTNQTGITTLVDLTGLSVTVTVPAGRTLRISAAGAFQLSVANSYMDIQISEDGTTVQYSDKQTVVANSNQYMPIEVIRSPAAGTHTYKLRASAGSGTMQMSASTTQPAFIMVEDITGFQNPYGGQAIPVGVLAQAQSTTVRSLTANTSFQDHPDLAVTFTVPAGRTIKATVYDCASVNVASSYIESALFLDGSTKLGRGYMAGLASGQIISHSYSEVFSPSAGTHTVKVSLAATGTGTITTYGGTTSPDVLVVEDITPTPAPANTAPSALLGQVVSTVSQGTGLGIGIGTTNTALTNLLVTVTVGAGRTLRINGHACFRGATAGMAGNLWIQEGATQLSVTPFWMGNTANDFGVEVSYVLSPSAGTHTYQLYAQTATSTMSMQAGAGEPAFITVEDITGAAVPTYSVGSMPLATVASEAWNTFTPVWSTPSGGTAPAIGNGTLACRYTKIGRTVIGTMRLLPGTTTTFGTAGNKWCLSLPFPAQTAISVWAIVGSAKLWGGGASQNVLVRLDGNAPNNLSLWYADAWPAGTERAVDATHPWTWANGHDVDIQFMYEAVA